MKQTFIAIAMSKNVRSFISGVVDYELDHKTNEISLVMDDGIEIKLDHKFTNIIIKGQNGVVIDVLPSKKGMESRDELQSIAIRITTMQTAGVELDEALIKEYKYAVDLCYEYPVPYEKPFYQLMDETDWIFDFNNNTKEQL